MYTGSGSKKVHDDLPTISHKSEIISITRDEGSEISSDFNSGRRPLSKSDEFSDPSSLVIEKWAPEFLLFTKTYGTFWEPDPTAVLLVSRRLQQRQYLVLICRNAARRSCDAAVVQEVVKEGKSESGARLVPLQAWPSCFTALKA